jgi:hypothetical protein
MQVQEHELAHVACHWQAVEVSEPFGFDAAYEQGIG